MAINKQQVIQPRVSINNGKGIARLVREADPDGVVTEHQIALSERMIDLLREAGQVDNLQHQAGTELRNLYERARLSMGQLGRTDGGAFASGDGFIRRNEEAWREYKRAMQQLGQWYPILRSVVVEDRHPSEYGARHRCHGPGMLRIALDRAVKHFGLDPRPKNL